MKNITKSLLAAALMAAIAAPAAAEISPRELQSAVRAATGPSGNVRAVITGKDSVHLYGYVEDGHFISRVERAAREAGAKNIRNGILRSN